MLAVMTRKKSKEIRTEEIVQAAVQEFLERGYEGASMDNIARRASLSKGGLYHHFRSKDEILIYANQKLSVPEEEIFRKVLLNRSMAKGLKEFISEYVHFWMNNKENLKFYFLSLVKAFEDEKLSDLYRRYAEDVFEMLESMFEMGMQNREFCEHNPSGRSMALITAINGILSYMMLGVGPSGDEIISYFHKIFIDEILI
jgi:AcrR family transcriptional regulator